MTKYFDDITLFSSLQAVNKESMENEVAHVHLNVPWAQQAEKKSQSDGDQFKIISGQKRVTLACFTTCCEFISCRIWCLLF